MEIRFVPFSCVGHEGKLWNTEDIAVNVFYTGFPHLIGWGVVKNTQRDAEDHNVSISMMDKEVGRHLHFLR